jgi:2-C-methyl-D-erythritol 4-phosphate cytidylyltransferase
MGSGAPKQYLEIAARPVLYHTLRALCAEPRIETIFVVLAPGDTRFAGVHSGELGHPIETLYCGGDTRDASVYNGLLAVRDAMEASDWVLVHDAARPCLTPGTLARLIDEVGDDEVGGILALPVADTLKRANGEDRIMATQSRVGLWQAQTPQMFRYGILIEALRRARGSDVTDEASAIERLGLKPRLVMGESCNLKITYPADFELASVILDGRPGRDGPR